MISLKKIRWFDTDGLDKNTIRNLWLMIWAIAGGMVWTNVTTGIAFTGFWKKIGATDLFYGVVSSFPYVACGFQFLASYILERTLKRKKLYVIASMIQRCVWIPFGLIPLIVPMEQTTLRLWSTALLALVSAAMMPMMNVAFISICDDVVPQHTRGRYFAVRSQVAVISGIVVGIVIGVVLDAFEGMVGYTIVFIMGGLLGIGDNLCYVAMKLPPMHAVSRQTGIWKMLRRVFADREFMRVVTFCTVWLFSVQVGSPYFYVYLQTEMQLTNVQITFFGQVTNNIGAVLFVTWWGRALDRHGSRPVMLVACVLSGLYSLMLAFVGGHNYLGVIICYLICGIAWSPYEIGAQNLFMRMSGKENTSMYTAVFYMFTQLAGLGLGGAVGGFLLDNVFSRLEALNLHMLGFTVTRYNYLFALCGLGRIASAVLLLPRVHEPGASTLRQYLTGWRRRGDRTEEIK